MASPEEPGDERRQHISGRDARGGEIILRTRLMRIIFIAGLAGFVLVAILWALG